MLAQQPPGTVTVRAARVLDGRGGTLQNAVVEISGGRIIRVDQRTGPVTVDLGAATLLPGMIDTHVHIGWHFGKDGRASNQGETPAEMALFAAENAWVTLINGFTTVQSAGAMSDRDLRDAINRGVLPGPRVLSSLGSANERTGDAAALRAYVVKQKAEGADFIKIFASKSIRDGGAPTMTLDQLQAACGEAKAQGLRSMVHAQSAEAAILAAKAGCTQVEHGAFANDEALKLMAERGVLLRPQHRAGAAELHREQVALPRHRQLHGGGLRVHGEGGADQLPDVQEGPRREGEDADGHRRRRRRARPERARNHHAREGRRSVADGRDHRRDLARRGVDGPRTRRSARSRPACRPTSWRWTATRSRTSPRCDASGSS